MFSLSPSRIARYFYHECERHLLFHATPRQQRQAIGIPDALADHSPVTVAILEGGYAWEREVVGRRIAERVLIAPAGQETPLHKRVFDAQTTVTHLRTLAPGQYLYQSTLMAPPSFYQAYGLDPTIVQMASCHPDLIVAEVSATGERCFRIVDLKASAALKTSHKVQATLYALLLQHVVEAEGIAGTVDVAQAGIWLYDTEAPEWFDALLMRPHLETLLRTDVPRMLAAGPAHVGWHLHYRCEWCEFYGFCRQEAEQSQSVSLLPYLSPRARTYLRSPGIDVQTLPEMQALLCRPDARAVLDGSASLQGKEERLRVATEALLQGQVRPFGNASCALPVGENIRLFLTLQREPISGDIYAAALLRTGNNQIFGGNERHEEQWVAATTTACRRVRQAFLLRVYEILAEVHAYNQGKEWQEQKSVQTYLFDSFEWEMLCTMLVEALTDAEAFGQPPDFAQKALALLCYFYSAELLLADEHPVEATPFPVVVLVDVIRTLVALPLPVAYQLADVTSALPPKDRPAFSYQPGDMYTFRLSNALRSNAIYAMWHEGYVMGLDAIKGELRQRLWATNSVLEGLRAAAVHPVTHQSVLFAWPVKFCFPDTEPFTQPLLSRLAFFTRYESLVDYLDVRNGRTLPRAERERRGLVLPLEYVGDRQFRTVLSPETAGAEPTDFRAALLTEDTPAGERAHMAYADYPHCTGSWWSPPKHRALWYVTDVSVDPHGGDGATVLMLEMKAGQSSPPLIEGQRYLLHRRYMDWNSHRVIKRLHQIDSTNAVPLVLLLTEPLTACQPLTSPPVALTQARALAAAAGFTESQHRAYQHLVDHSLTLVWGPPGTGKTHFLATAILCLLEAYRRTGQPLRVCISASTHAAIEHCLRKMLQLHERSQILQHDLWLAKLGTVSTEGTAPMPAIEPAACPNYLVQHPHCVVGGTTYAMLRAFPHGQTTPFDVVVLDEGSQVRVPEALLVLSRLAPHGRLVIAGDDLQLPPIVEGTYPDPAPGEPLVHRSIFEAIRSADQDHSLTCQLLDNFRMHQTLCLYPAEHLYGHEYRPFNTAIANQRLALRPATATGPLVEAILDPAYPLVVCILEGLQTGAENRVEAACVAQVAQALRVRLCQPPTHLPFPDDPSGDRAFWQQGLFIVSPHHVQIRAIRQSLTACGLRPPFFVDTVDKMQGQECEAVMVSYGVSDPEQAMREGTFIYSLQRLNVAITRAKAKSIVFLPRPLLTPTLQVLESREAVRGLAYMVGLEHFAQAAHQTRTFPVDGRHAARWVVHRR